jgi:hypothetical protein
MCVRFLLLRMGVGREADVVFLVGESCPSARGVHALLKCREPAIRVAAIVIIVVAQSFVGLSLSRHCVRY